MVASIFSRIKLWLLFFSCLLLSVGATQVSYFERFNWILYDSLHPYLGQEASGEVVVVGIDDKSLDALGRWPWTRMTHNRLLSKLKTLDTQAVGLDVLLSEPEVGADSELGATLADMGNVVLAIAPEQNVFGRIDAETMPVLDLAVNAAGFGHVDYELSLDGICRSVYLHAGLDQSSWPAFPLAILQAAKRDYQLPPSPEWSSSMDLWRRDHFFLIPYLPRKFDIPHVSYIDVLDGLADDQIRGKFVLVGATAVGLGDQLSTPVSGLHQRMAGVDINAHALDALIQGRAIQPTSYLVHLSLIVISLIIIFIAGAVLSYARLGLFLPVMQLLILGSSFAFLRQSHLWIPPVEAMSGVLLFYLVFGFCKQRVVHDEVLMLSDTLSRQQSLDPISDLPNRKALEQTVGSLIADARRRGGLVAILVIHIGKIRQINDRLGFKSGDEVLRIMAERIQDTVGVDAQLAKISSEFAVVSQFDSEADIDALGVKLQDALFQPLQWQDVQYSLPCSIGVSLFPEHSQSYEGLINNAFIAMHSAKSEKYPGLFFFSQQLKHDIEERSSLEADLNTAIAKNEFEVVLQPQVCARSHRIKSAEVLLRWRHPEKGNISPAHFIPLAEETGAIIEIGQWVLEQACVILQDLIKQEINPVKLAVNVSAVQLKDPSFANHIRTILEKHSIYSPLIELEVTETALMEDMGRSVQILSAIRRSGVKIAVDDFGTGYSSLNYLNSFPVDCLKIDRAFVRDIGVRDSSEEIMLTIISMAHTLGLSVVAEGIETSGQADFLYGRSDLLQGFYFARPMSVEAFVRYLKESGLAQ